MYCWVTSVGAGPCACPSHFRVNTGVRTYEMDDLAQGKGIIL
jgi:hypothetical protein